jgi:hypothetical protein
MSAPRPKSATAEMKMAAAGRVVADLVKAGHLTPNEAQDATEQIAQHGSTWGDGYELAKALDDNEYWDCNLDMAERLDGYSSEVRAEITKAQKAWFESEKPAPPFATGAHVAFKRGAEQTTGVIDGVYEYGVAQYLVKVDGDPAADLPSKSRAIIDWEACALVPEGVAA